MAPLVVLGLLLLAAGIVAERASRSGIVTTLRALPMADLGLLALLTFVPVLVVLAWSLWRRSFVRTRMMQAAIIVGVLMAGLLIGYLLYDKANPAPAITAFGATAATVGWIAQMQANINLSRKQHTLNILLQLRQSDTFNRHRTRSAEPGVGA